MGRRRATKRHVKFAQGESQHAPDAWCRLLAAHPAKAITALAVGPCVRIVDCEGNKLLAELAHSAAVRAVQFSPDGQLLLTAGDERTVRLWDTEKWSCVASWKSPKKVSAGTFTQDSKHVIFADKYGDVSIGDVSIRNDLAQPQDPALLMGHLCSIVASLLVSQDSRYVVSTDKDRKVRVSVLPDLAHRMLGAVEIQSYCLGHSYFVSSSTWAAAAQPGGHPLLVTGSGDGTVRLWDPEQGTLLDTYVASEPEPEPEPAEGTQQDKAAAAGSEGAAEAAEDSGPAEDEAEPAGQAGEGCMDVDEAQQGEEGSGAEDDMETRVAMGPKCAPVNCVASSRDGLFVAALVEGRDGVLILRLDPQAKKLALVHELAFSGVRFPSDAVFDAQNRLWVIGGPPLDTSKSAHVGVAKISGAGELSPCTNELIPGALLLTLEQRSEEEEKQLESGALVPAYSKQLSIYRKRWLTPDILEQQKRARSDFKETERLRALAGEQPQ